MCALVIVLGAVAWQLPAAPLGHVNDFAGVLSASTIAHVEERLSAHERETSNQIVVVTVPSLGGGDIADVAFAIGERWRVGQHGADNGVLLLIASKEHRTRIEVGKGLEGSFTDLQAHVVLDEVVKPALSAGDYDHAVEAGTNAIIEAVRGEAVTAARPSPSPYLMLGFALLLFILFVFFPRAGMVLLLMAGRRDRRGFSGGGGRFGGGGASGSW